MAPHHMNKGEVERFAVLYSDGSAGILAASYDLERAEDERRATDLHERPEDRPQLARVWLTIVEIIEAPRPADSGPCPVCGRR